MAWSLPGQSPFDPRVRFLLEQDFPFVSHGRTEFTTPHPYVDFDNEAFTRLAVQRLVSKGRTRLTMVLPAERYTFAQHLRYGFVSEARKLGVEYELHEALELDSSPTAIADHVRARLERPDAPDGYICVGEVIAIATVGALIDRNVTLGRDADVVTKRASPVFDQFRPRIDSVFEDLRMTGHEIGRLLLARIDGQESGKLQSLISPVADFEPEG